MAIYTGMNNYGCIFGYSITFTVDKSRSYIRKKLGSGCLKLKPRKLPYRCLNSWTF